MFNEETNEFVYIKPVTLKLEHSLLSVSKWESKWKIPFLHDDKAKPKTTEMMMDYIRFMTINDVPDYVYNTLDVASQNKIVEYIQSTPTATTFSDDGTRNNKKQQILTSELIYYWMVAAQIPLECERWHIHRLLTLIRIYSIENDTSNKGKKPKIGKRQQAMDRSELNRKRREMYNTKG